MHGRFLFLFVLASAALWAAPAPAATDIRLREHVVVATPVVRLGDVAEVISADRAAARRLAALPLMPAPAAGSERFLRRREVADLLAAHGESLSEIRFDGAAQVSIAAPGSSAKTDDLGNSHRQAALLAGRIERSDQTPQPGANINDTGQKFDAIIENYLNSTADPPGAWRVSCEVAERHLGLLETATSPPVCRGGEEPWTGRQRFVVSLETAAGPVHVPVYAEVENLSYSVIVAIRPIARGDVITAANVELRSMPLPAGAVSRSTPIRSVESVVGMQARQSIQVGQAIFNDQVQQPQMVKRGDLVTVSSHGGGIRVRTTARARQDGVKGEIIQVETLTQRERFDVRVVGPNQTAVFAAAAVRPAEVLPAERAELAQRPIPLAPPNYTGPIRNAPITK